MVHSNAAQLIELFQDLAVQQFLTSFGDFVVGVLGKALEVVVWYCTSACAHPHNRMRVREKTGLLGFYT